MLMNTFVYYVKFQWQCKSESEHSFILSSVFGAKMTFYFFIYSMSGFQQ